MVVVPVNDVHRGNYLSSHGWRGYLHLGFEKIGHVEGNEISHQGSLHKAGQNVCGMMLMV